MEDIWKDECLSFPPFTATSCMKVVCAFCSLVTVSVPCPNMRCQTWISVPRVLFRLLAQGLVLNAETSRSGNLGVVAKLREDEDEAYFSSYGHYGIHEEMLKV